MQQKVLIGNKNVFLLPTYIHTYKRASRLNFMIILIKIALAFIIHLMSILSCMIFRQEDVG